MRHYEIVLIVHPDRSAQVQDMVSRYQKIVTDGSGSVHRYEDWGRRQLAYPINKVLKGHYLLFNIECGLDVLTMLEDAFRFNDAIIRNAIFSRQKAPEGESQMMSRKDKERRRR